MLFHTRNLNGRNLLRDNCTLPVFSKKNYNSRGGRGCRSHNPNEEEGGVPLPQLYNIVNK